MARQRRMGTNQGAGAGSSSDIRDRFRDVYKPGARSVPKPGLRSPVEGIKKIGGVVKGVMRGRKKAKPA